MKLHTCVLLAFVLLDCMKMYAEGQKKIYDIERGSVKIVSGDKRCITDCSRLSSEHNVFMQCSIGDCKTLETASSTSQRSEFNAKRDIFLQKYSEGGKDKLGLYVKWSPVDNVSVQHTKGYMIKITDGNSTYSTCYNITTPMLFENNAHDTYYNDCFGKAKGTRIVPNSLVTIHITPLPLWYADKDDGTIIVNIEIPGCDNIILHSLPECQLPGGRPTNKSCISKTCNTSSKVDGNIHDIACSVSTYDFRSAGPERCVEVNRTRSGFTNGPIHLKRPQEWYKYIDPNTKEVKIALNFSWMPPADSSVENLLHYYMEIMPSSKHTLATFDTCYSIHTPLTYHKHRNAVFYYDCYGRVDHTRVHLVEPGHQYHVHVESRPAVIEGEGDNSGTQFYIDIPDCENEAMTDVAACVHDTSWGDVKLKIVEKFCHNHSVKVNYSLPGHLKTARAKATIYVCQTGTGLAYCDVRLNDYFDYEDNFPAVNDPCLCLSLYVDMSLDAPSGTLYASVPSAIDNHRNLSVFLQPSDLHYHRVVQFFDFSVCSPPLADRSWLIIMIVISCLLCVIALLSLVCYFHQGQCALKRFITSICQPRDSLAHPVQYTEDIPEDCYTRPTGPSPGNDTVMPDKVRVYVVFMDDHPLHKKVVHWFCCFLKSDLGLDVRLNIWEEEKVAMNKSKYMMNQVENASKVIIICSAGTASCLDRQYTGDMITPVIQHACSQTFIGKDPGKFLVGYFPYSKPEHVPEMLHDQCMMYFSLFKLMKQFEQFYFRIVGVEQFQEGGIQRIEKIAFDRYFDPQLTSCGQALKQSIGEMAAFDQNNSTWYIDRHGMDMPIANIPPPPTMLLEDEHQISHEDGRPSIVHMKPNPPPGIVNRHPQTTQKVDRHVEMIYRPKATTHFPAKKNAGDYQKLNSVTSTDDSSFILTDTDHLSPSTPDTPGSPSYSNQNRPRIPMQRNSSGDNPQSFHPASFNDDDYAADESENSSMDSRLLESNVTQITRLGLTQSQERLANAMPDLLNFPVFDEIQPDHDVPSGPVRLANVENHIEDFENEFRTINTSADYQCPLP